MERTADESRKDHAQRKSQVLHLLELAIEYEEQYGEENDTEAFRMLLEDLEKGEFTIVVVGEFSAGKSTLLNAMMRKRILPSFSSETTATVNFLRHREKAQNGEAGIVYYYDGKQVQLDELSLDVISQYATTKGDAKNISHIDLYLESDFLKDGVKLVDSPGLNGLEPGHREITEAQIKQSHASIFLFSGDHPGTRSDFEFLHDLQKHVQTIFFVLNKIDDIKEEEGETVENVIDTLKNNYHKQFPEEKTIPEIWPIAARQALAARDPDAVEYYDQTALTMEKKHALEQNSRMEAFENRLFHFLTCGEKTQQELLAPVQRVISVISQQKTFVQEEIDCLSSTKDTVDFEEQIAQIQQMIEDINKENTGIRIEAAKMIQDILRMTRENVRGELADYANRKLKEIEELDDIEELQDYQSTFEGMYLAKAQSIAYHTQMDLRTEIVHAVQLQYNRYVNQLVTELPPDGFSVNIEMRNHLNTDIGVFEVGLDKMDEKVKEKEKELAELEIEREKAEDVHTSDKAVENKRKKLESEIENLQKACDTLQFQALSPIEHYSKEVTETVDREGVLGKIVQFCIGGKDRVRLERCEDSRAHDEDVEKRDRQIQRNEEKMEKLEEELRKLSDVNVSASEKKLANASNKVYAARDELNNLLKKNTAEIDKKHRRYVSRLKSALRNYCDTANEEVVRLIQSGLNQSESSYVELVLNVVEEDTRYVLENHKKHIESLQEQMQQSVDNRNQRIAQLEEQIQKMDEILRTAVGVQVELEGMETDRIEQIAL